MNEGKTDFVFASNSMCRMIEKLRKVSDLDTTVLLHGESGTGKEVAAWFLHENHRRRKLGPMVCVHCGAVPDSLFESELFGHVKGAFTGADRDRIGRFEQANGGTLFLDEISTMSPEAQVRLLRVLQERRVTPLGSTESREVDVRVIVATNQDLKALIAEGKFRLDLYYRVSTYPVELPALRDRPTDILQLTGLFSRRVTGRLGLERAKQFSPGAVRALAAYGWPGNARELENAVEYACIQSGSREVVETQDLPLEIAGVDAAKSGELAGVVVTEEGLSFRTAVTNLERELILQSLRLSDGNKAKAAKLLDLKRTTFLEKLRRFRPEEPDRDLYPERSSEEESRAYEA